MSAVRIVTGVSKSAITVLVRMPVAAMLAIASVKMESLAMVLVNSKLINFYTALIITPLYMYIDIDECAEGTDECDEYCYNTIGSYSCDCTSAGPGYRLHGDGTTCESKPP